MSAYHNVDWAEYYDLWVRVLFGTGPMKDIPVFASILSDIVASNLSSSPTHTNNKETSISIVDIGTVSGRVLTCLQYAIMSVKGGGYFRSGGWNLVPRCWTARNGFGMTPLRGRKKN